MITVHSCFKDGQAYRELSFEGIGGTDNRAFRHRRMLCNHFLDRPGG